MNFDPIGVFRSSKINPYEAARQGSLDPDSYGHIELTPGKNFEQALEGLEKFSHIWVIFEFHRNQSWKPKVSPPRGSDKKVGVFASRSPYRPNSIGISCVRLQKISGLQLAISGHDLLDQTPILDIKPYLNYADSFPEATLGWIESKPTNIHWSTKSQEQLHELKSLGISELRAFVENHLAENPTNTKKKRLYPGPQEDQYLLAYRTWRVLFSMKAEDVHVHKILSGYSVGELDNAEDPYLDKSIHRIFRNSHPN